MEGRYFKIFKPLAVIGEVEKIPPKSIIKIIAHKRGGRALIKVHFGCFYTIKLDALKRAGKEITIKKELLYEY